MTMPMKSQIPDTPPPFSSISMIAVEEIADALREESETPTPEPSDTHVKTPIAAFFKEAGKSFVILVLAYYFAANAIVPHLAHALGSADSDEKGQR